MPKTEHCLTLALVLAHSFLADVVEIWWWLVVDDIGEAEVGALVGVAPIVEGVLFVAHLLSPLFFLVLVSTVFTSLTTVLVVALFPSVTYPTVLGFFFFAVPFYRAVLFLRLPLITAVFFPPFLCLSPDALARDQHGLFGVTNFGRCPEVVEEPLEL